MLVGEGGIGRGRGVLVGTGGVGRGGGEVTFQSVDRHRDEY